MATPQSNVSTLKKSQTDLTFSLYPNIPQSPTDQHRIRLQHCTCDVSSPPSLYVFDYDRNEWLISYSLPHLGLTRQHRVREFDWDTGCVIVSWKSEWCDWGFWGEILGKAFAAAGASNPVIPAATHRDWSCLVTGRSKIYLRYWHLRLLSNIVLIY